MKSSVFNLYVPLDGKRYLIFNALHKSVAIVDKELKEILVGEEMKLETIETELLRSLQDLGVVVQNKRDDLKALEGGYKSWKENTEMSSFIIFPTFSCNLSCSYCYERGLDLTKKPMTEETTKSVLSFIKKATIFNKSKRLTLGFFGGEPLLKHELCNRIAKGVFEFCEERGIGYYGTLTTNGTMLTEEVVDRVGRYISSTQITLDGSREAHDAKRFRKDGNGTYEDLMAGAFRLLKIGKHVTFRVHISEDLLSLKELFEDLKLREFDVFTKFHLYFALTSPADICVKYHQSDLFLESWELSQELILRAQAMAIKAGLRSCLDINKPFEEKINRSCGYLNKGVYMIDPDGDIYHCPVFTGQKEYSLGSIGKDGEVNWTHTYHDLTTRDPGAIPGCNSCPILPLCNGGCPISAKMRNGTFSSCGCESRGYFIENVQSSILQHYHGMNRL